MWVSASVVLQRHHTSVMACKWGQVAICRDAGKVCRDEERVCHHAGRVCHDTGRMCRNTERVFRDAGRVCRDAGRVCGDASGLSPRPSLLLSITGDSQGCSSSAVSLSHQQWKCMARHTDNSIRHVASSMFNGCAQSYGTVTLPALWRSCNDGGTYRSSVVLCVRTCVARANPLQQPCQLRLPNRDILQFHGWFNHLQ